MKWPSFAYAKADTIEQLWRCLDEAGPDAKVLAGGQSLLASLAFRLSEPSALVDISSIEALKGIRETANGLRIGGLTTHTQLGASPLVRSLAPLLASAVPLIAHPAIRNRGTLGGNLAYADPASELPACLVALEAVIVVLSRNGERRVPAARFFVDLFETALIDDEIIAAVEIPAARTDQRFAIDEVARRSGDYAMAGLACALSFSASKTTDARLVFFGVGPTPVLAARASKALASAGVAAAQAALADDLAPYGDQHASPEMKRHLARVLLGRLVAKLTEQGSAGA
jgi:aerobic carbon-monoxide dehydrogenase medium subunit